jgi:putative pyruvate formate lyase activating enzyme
MGKKNVRFFIDQTGRLSIEDLSPFEAEVLRKIGLSVECSPIENGGGPAKYAGWKDILIPLRKPLSLEGMVELHDRVLADPLSLPAEKADSSISLIELKKKILKEYLKECSLCGFRCGGIRASEGKCPIRRKAGCHQFFVHLGEEPEIGTTLAMELSGCNIDCRFCQKGELIQTEDSGRALNQALWREIHKESERNRFQNISFLGGNPDQSLMGVLSFLEKAPPWADRFPIIWHTNGYSSPDLYNLLNGLVDLWVFDFKYFHDPCALALSEAPHYRETAHRALQTVLTMNPDTPVIVRHLILPGHWDCCQKPLIDWFSHYKSGIIFHPMAQYKPLWKITEADGRLSFPLPEQEYRKTLEYAQKAGLLLTRLTH